MIIRKMFGSIFANDALTHNAISPNSTKTTNDMHDYIGNAIESGLLDVDNSGETKALEDGVMIVRGLLGSVFAGDNLIHNAISPNSPYYNAENASDLVKANIDAQRRNEME